MERVPFVHVNWCSQMASRVLVAHPEFMHVAPGGGMADVWDNKNLPIWIDPPNVTGIDFRPKEAKPRAKKR